MSSTLSSNATIVRPARFYINGLHGVPHVKYYYIFLCLVYVVTVIGNVFIMLVIYLQRTLHTPKYIAVFNLAVADFGGSSALIPKIIDVFFFKSQYISYEACFSTMFFCFLFILIQSLTLLILAYDRLIAICLPLRYHAIITNIAMSSMIMGAWAFSLILIGFSTGWASRLSFCNSIVINSYFCDHGPTYKLACGNTNVNNIMAYIGFVATLCAPVILITITYFCIALALMRIASWAERTKALKTCISHLILVTMFYLPIIAINIAAVTIPVHPNTRIINLSLSATMPPMLNPIIYTLKTEEVVESVKKLYQRTKCKVHTPNQDQVH
ncbi:olfactory receptor 52Z1P-like [Conger conger]|uniref:olfactory receptor 52Z1P-like n=1 Tax=Conger conger TaxID=82655 RepID=UPI002A59D27B|nr:olfactory receptor 52Z1P-like [Conger conger]